jgi:YidC/Oxa1 family membrane protein insertase
MPILANVIQDAFSPLISFFEAIMVFIHDHLVGGSWGLAIIGLTVLIRAVLVPLTYRQLKSMQEMQRLSPQIAALKEKYKDDKQRQQQEIMTFYRENKINPLASCLPLLLQLPVFISLFYMLRTDLKLDICGPRMREFYSKELGKHVVSNAQIPQNAVTVAGHNGKVPGLTEVGCSTPFHSNGALHIISPGSAKFLFIHDITYKATGAVLIVLILLYVGSQIASTLVATATADPNQRRLMLLLPLVFVVILYRYPAGLLVYWITTNVWTIGQQSVIKRRIGPPPAPAVAKGAVNGKPARALKPALAGAGVVGSGGGEPDASVAPAKRLGRKAPQKAQDDAAANGKPAAPPPRPPRKKKKRSGRRR